MGGEPYVAPDYPCPLGGAHECWWHTIGHYKAEDFNHSQGNTKRTRNFNVLATVACPLEVSPDSSLLAHDWATPKDRYSSIKLNLAH